MTEREFFKEACDKSDALSLAVGILEAECPYALIGGLAVNAYAEPMTTLDADFAVPPESIQALKRAFERAGGEVKLFPHILY